MRLVAALPLTHSQLCYEKTLWHPRYVIVTAKICVLCGRWFSNHIQIVSETTLSCDTVHALSWSELYFASCCALKQTRAFASESRKVMCLLKFTDFKKWCFDVSHSRHQSVCQQPTVWDQTSGLRLRKIELIKWINLLNVLRIGFVKLEIRQWLSTYQDQFVFGLVSLDCGLLEFFFLSYFLRKKRFYLSSSC